MHDVTDQVTRIVTDSGVQTGTVHVFHVWVLAEALLPHVLNHSHS